MFVDLTPIRKYRDYRLLFVGQLVSFLGSMASSVVIPYQVYEITKSSLIVGLIGIVQIVPLVIFGLWGGLISGCYGSTQIDVVLRASNGSLHFGTFGKFSFT